MPLLESAITLIMAAQTGDAAALSRLLAVCQADARRYAYKHCHASDVDDAVQESLLIISRKVNGLKAALRPFHHGCSPSSSASAENSRE